MIKVFKNDEGNYVLELWEASTKHPDSVFHMEDFELASWTDKDNPRHIELQVFQWLLECASKLTFPIHAKQLTEYALENWCVWEK